MKISFFSDADILKITSAMWYEIFHLGSQMELRNFIGSLTDDGWRCIDIVPWNTRSVLTECPPRTITNCALITSSVYCPIFDVHIDSRSLRLPSGHSAIWFEDTLKYGRSEPTDTFDNPTLCGNCNDVDRNNAETTINLLSVNKSASTISNDSLSASKGYYFVIDCLEVWRFAMWTFIIIFAAQLLISCSVSIVVQV